MTALVRAVVRAQDAALMAVLHARERRARGRMIAAGVRGWLHRLGAPNPASTSAEEGRGTKYPTTREVKAVMLPGFGPIIILAVSAVLHWFAYLA